jgi:glycosyltransferase involved in cell wall biosynthesis
MPDHAPPEEVRGLAEERARLRADRRFDQADALRERIRSAGWEVVDRPEGFDLVPARPLEPPRVRAEAVPSALAEPPSADWSLHWLHEGWADDVRRGVSSFDRHAGGRSIHHVIVEVAPAPAGAWPDHAEVIRLQEDPGFGAARNAGLRRSRGKLVAVVDGSVEATGDALGPLEEALSDRRVGVAGPAGLVTGDLRTFRPAIGPEVDAIEGYLLALRRELLDRVAFDRRYRFYRVADIDLCFQVQALGLRAIRVDVPIRRHAHRAWEAAPSGDRDRLSKRNMYRFLDRFRGRTDLLLRPDRP